MASKKLKSFKLLEILYNETDEFHKLKTNELIEHLAEMNIACDRRSIYDDIELFKQLGIDVKKDVGYYIDNRQFALEEVKILTDALSSAEFLPVAVAEQIKDKLRGTLSITEAEIIEEQFFANFSKDRLLKNGETVTAIIRELILAIHNNRSVTITMKNNSKHQVSPYSLVFYNQKYYLIGYNYHPKRIFHFRIDNIISVKKSSYSYMPVSEVSEYEDAIDTAEYLTKTFKMFAGEEKSVVMRIHKDIIPYMLEYFPELDFKPTGSVYIKGKTNVNVSDGFYNFILGYGEQIQVLEPKEVADEVKKRALKIADMYK